ncbi:hypothetical protein O1611_g6689 [Lasiodiplodia mahajangana]|uniref:Uncharacterized protein n=1 Tax=Lasiodiplodia mahajangana TaxID=1108764 RepID=A0ACC2JHL0_9PEZI|nr:hypothetical protein O1611_g6689 [Lasiodiplodia mahajangana]
MATPSTPNKSTFRSCDTPQKTALRTLIKFRDDKKLPISNNDIFKYTGFTKTAGYRVLKDTGRQSHNNPCDETRGRPSRLSDDQVDQIIEFLENESWEARQLPWANLCNAAGLDFPADSKPPHPQTVRTALAKKGWKKCIACVKFWTCENIAERRDRWARDRLHDYELDLSFYRKIRYSDEVHFKFSPEGKLIIIRKAGTRYCPDCIHYRTRPSDSGNRTICLNAWACIGYDFKSKLIWYDVANANDAYLNQILKPEVQKWLDRGDNFILEDGASGYGEESENNVVERWKDETGLEYFNCPGAPDLSPIENAWKSPKSHVRRTAIWDETALKEVAEEGWEALKQSTINEWCDSVPYRLLDVVRVEG